MKPQSRLWRISLAYESIPARLTSPSQGNFGEWTPIPDTQAQSESDHSQVIRMTASLVSFTSTLGSLT